jgi:Ethanolamine utilization protein EutJ (predicted chaperonin)
VRWHANGYEFALYHRPMESGGFGGLFGDPDDMQRRIEEMAEQMQGAQKVAWADNAIKLAVEMTVASISALDLQGTSDEQAVQVRDAIRIVFPEAVTLVREAREGLS